MEWCRAVLQEKTDHLVNELVLNDVIVIQNQAEWTINLCQLIRPTG
jgi:hypothetical protein